MFLKVWKDGGFFIACFTFRGEHGKPKGRKDEMQAWRKHQRS